MLIVVQARLPAGDPGGGLSQPPLCGGDVGDQSQAQARGPHRLHDRGHRDQPAALALIERRELWKRLPIVTDRANRRLTRQRRDFYPLPQADQQQ
jgi:hypothetical protein